jgi:hypothetical protein
VKEVTPARIAITGQFPQSAVVKLTVRPPARAAASAPAAEVRLCVIATSCGVVQTWSDVPFTPQGATVEAEWTQDEQRRTITATILAK